MTDYSSITDEMIQEAIKNCKWRTGFHDTPVCRLDINICSVTIDRGRCLILRELFKKAREEGNKEGGSNR